MKRRKTRKYRVEIDPGVWAVMVIVIAIILLIGVLVFFNASAK